MAESGSHVIHGPLTSEQKSNIEERARAAQGFKDFF